MRAELLAISREHGEQVIDVARIELRRHERGRTGKSLPIPPRQLATAGGPALEIRQTRTQNCGLQLVETAVHAELDVLVRLGLAAVAEPFEPVGQGAVIRGDRATIAERAQVLGGVETERPGCAERAD